MATPNTFSNDPKLEWITEPKEDRNMKLLEDFFYIDPDGRKWNAPANSIVNGASIPVFLWSAVGSPYTGEYRRASIVHDVACDDVTVSRREADKMFYFACIAGGCSQRQAGILFAGVRIGAWLPRVRLWRTNILKTPSIIGEQKFGLAEQSVVTTFEEIRSDILAPADPLSFDQLENLVDRHLAVKEEQ